MAFHQAPHFTVKKHSRNYGGVVCWLGSSLILGSSGVRVCTHTPPPPTIPNTATGQSDLGHFSMDLLLDDPRLRQIDVKDIQVRWERGRIFIRTRDADHQEMKLGLGAGRWLCTQEQPAQV